MGVCGCSVFCCAERYVHSSFAIILMEKTELVTLLGLSAWRLVVMVVVVWLSLQMSWVCRRCVIVVFPGHARLLFLE